MDVILNNLLFGDLTWIYENWQYPLWVALFIFLFYAIITSTKPKISIIKYSDDIISQITKLDRNDNIISITNYNNKGKVESREVFECKAPILKKHIYYNNKLIQTEYYIQSSKKELYKKNVVYNGFNYIYKDSEWFIEHHDDYLQRKIS
jgi:hypothetical protein